MDLYEFTASLVYIGSSRPARDRETLLKKEEEEEKEKKNEEEQEEEEITLCSWTYGLHICEGVSLSLKHPGYRTPPEQPRQTLPFLSFALRSVYSQGQLTTYRDS